MNDLRLALRSLRNRPLFALVAIITFALGIGSTTTLFTIVNAVLLRPLPYPEANRILSISEAQGGKDGEVVATPDYFAWASAAQSFDAMAMYGGTSRVFAGQGAPARISGSSVSYKFFSVFGGQPALGRTFRADEDLPDGPDVVVLGHDVWEQRFGGDSSIVGRAISLDAHPYTVLGVMPAGFAAPRAAKFWLPMQMDPAPGNGTTYFAEVVGRLRTGVRPEAARAELAALGTRRFSGSVVLRAEPGRTEPVVMTLHDRMFGSTRRALLLLGAVALLLLIACANVANLLLARAASRQREFAVRVALGATRWRLARQLLWESVVVSVMGGALGLLIPIWSVAFFPRISPASVAHVEDIHVNAAVLAFAAGVSLLTGLVFGLIPAFGATRADACASLKEGGARSTGTMAQHRTRQALVITELATTLVLLTRAGLLTRSFVRAMAVDEALNRNIAPRWFNSVVIDVFAALALVLATVGLYGVMAYQVAQRTHELGIRMALGADRARVMRVVLRNGMGLALLGTACGVALSLALSRFLAGMLFGVRPHDVTTFATAPGVMILVALAACYFPARRATKVDPMVALRYE